MSKMKKISISGLEAYNMGIKAYVDGKSKLENPFPNGSTLQAHWRAGFTYKEANENRA